MAAPYAHIACCVDDSEASDRAVEEARRLRELGAGRLSIVYAAPQPLVFAGMGGALVPDPRDLASASARWLEERAGRVPGAEPVLLEGYPPVAVCDWAREAGVDLLVAAAHRGRVERVLLGGFASYLAYHAPCAVLLVRPAAAAADDPAMAEATPS
ncbi:MAG TPA: universal stress protein [Miltoncostaeaceae bacterium]|nr:universal stress protein [Miltoncostaeaceae bacterium]